MKIANRRIDRQTITRNHIDWIYQTAVITVVKSSPSSDVTRDYIIATILYLKLCSLYRVCHHMAILCMLVGWYTPCRRLSK